jgi:hypothetical protein
LRRWRSAREVSPIAITATKTAGHEHAEDHVPALFGCVGEQPGDHGASLSNRDRCVTRGALDPTRHRTAAEPAHAPIQASRRPPLLRPEMRASRDQLGERRDGVEVAGGGDPDEPVRVQVVAEQERDVSVRRREQARPAVVDEVALVDRLEPEREALRRERPKTPSRSGSARSCSPQSGLSAAASAASVSQTSVAEEVANGLDGAVDVLVGVRE